MTTTALPYEAQATRAGIGAFPSRLLADWRDVRFVHYAIDPALLQPHVPFDLDLYDGKAWVSLVAFTQVGLRPAFGGALTAWAMRPVATHGFLNLRTYVNAQGRRAIYFIAEWIPNRFAHLVGPRLYGLPFHLGRLDYDDEHRQVIAGGETFNLRLTTPGADVRRSALEGTLDHFLLERYTAFTCRNGRSRMFQIRHQPWFANRVDVTVENDSLIRRAAPWFAHASLVCAHASPGVFDVEMSGPRRVTHLCPAAGNVRACRHG